MSALINLCGKSGYCSVTYLPHTNVTDAKDTDAKDTDEEDKDAKDKDEEDKDAKDKKIRFPLTGAPVYTNTLLLESGVVSGFPVEMPTSIHRTRTLYLRDDSNKESVFGKVTSFMTPAASKYKQVILIEENKTGVKLDIITSGLNSIEIDATYDEFRALDLYVKYKDFEKYNGITRQYKDTLPTTVHDDSDLIENVRKNKVSYSKYFEYFDHINNSTVETNEIQKTKEKIKNMTELLPITTSSAGGKVKSRRKIKSKKNSKSHKGKSRKGKSHKGNSKKTRRKSNRRSR